MTTIALGNTVYTHPVAKVMISIPDNLLERLDALARANRETRSGLLRRLVEQEISVGSAQSPQGIRRSTRSAYRHGAGTPRS